MWVQTLDYRRAASSVMEITRGREKAMTNVEQSYRGYLSPHVERIRMMHLAGADTPMSWRTGYSIAQPQEADFGTRSNDHGLVPV